VIGPLDGRRRGTLLAIDTPRDSCAWSWSTRRRFEAARRFHSIALPFLGDPQLKTTTPTTMRLLLADPYVHKEVVSTPGGNSDTSRAQNIHTLGMRLDPTDISAYASARA
jgi:hypothetical protein